jgi:hypothetical protein
MQQNTPPRPPVIPLRVDTIPSELRSTPRWICWRYELEAGTWRKKPKRTDGHGNASSTNPSTWSTFDQAADAYLMGEFDGLGFIITGDDGIVGVDLDDHVLDGVLDGLAQGCVDSIAGYWEVSPSGSGVKGLIRGRLDRSRADHDSGVEMYSHGRYFAITGHALRCDLEQDQTEQLARFVREQFDERVSAGPSSDDDDEFAAFASWASRRGPLDDWTIERVKDEVLAHLDPEGYADWIKVGQALHHQFQGSGDGLALWDEWSQGSGKWVEGVCDQRWDTFDSTRPGGVTLGSLLHETSTAREAAERVKRVQHLDTLKAGVLKCGDVEALKDYIRDVLQKDNTVDDTDRNGALTVSVQERFKDLGSPQKREDVRRLLRPVAAPSSSGASGPDWLSRWVYVTDSDRFFNLDSKTTVTGRGFDAINSHQMPLSQDGVHRESAADYSINVWRIQEVKQSLYAPGQGEVFNMLGVTWANEYREDTVPSSGPGGEAAVRMVLAHLERLFPDTREREILLSWMAHNVRHPGRKIRWAPYLYGPQGTGKTFIGELLGMVMGESNTRVLAGSTIQSSFNGWSTGFALVVVEEVYQAGHLFETEEKLKAPIANNTIDVHRKGKDSYRAPNFTNYLLLSNHPDGMPINEGDRRFFFLQCALTADEAQALAAEGYFDSLFDICRASVPGLRRWLLQEVQMHNEFDPDGRAPGTEAKRQVIEMSKTDAEVFVEDFLVGKDETTTSRVAAKLEAAGIEGVKSRGLAKLLERRRFQFYKIMRVGGVPSRVYVRANTASRTEESVRNALLSQMEGEFGDA